MDNNNAAIVNKYQLPQRAYSDRDPSEYLNVFYISDIHLETHIEVEKEKREGFSIDKYIKTVARGLVTPSLVKSTKYESYLIVFLGDIAQSLEYNKLFYYSFYNKLQYYRYKDWKKNTVFTDFVSATDNKKKLEQRIEILAQRRQRLVKRVGKFMKYTSRFRTMSTFEIEKYLARRKDFPVYAGYLLRELILLDNRIKTLSSYTPTDTKQCNVLSFPRDHHFNVFSVLGNHELYYFKHKKDAVEKYKKEIPYITFLDNEAHCLNSRINREYDCVIVGGTGFSKYNDKYNADNMINAGDINHVSEVKESDLLSAKVKSSIPLSSGYYYHPNIEKKLYESSPVIVISHMPPKDWTEELYSKCVYFCGHDHKNKITIEEETTIIANNQVGYINPEINLKKEVVGLNYNPFIEYEDGAFEINTREYLLFCRYCGEGINSAYHIEKQLETQEAKFYMIKSNGFYMFIVINKRTGTKICNGGVIKTISDVTNIEYFEKTFLLMVESFLKALEPYRKAQESISKRIKECGLKGTIHGCIIDIDFYNHIALDPITGKARYYYSPIMGTLEEYASLEDLLINTPRLKCDNREVLIKQIRKQNSIKPYNDTNEYETGLRSVSMTEGMYGVSREMHKFQRLFTSNVLREWNDNYAKKLIPPIESIEEFNPIELVEKHWMNLTKISPEKIDVRILKKCFRKSAHTPFPYKSYNKYHGIYYPQNKATEEELKTFVSSIPVKYYNYEFIFEGLLFGLGKDIFELCPADLWTEDRIIKALRYTCYSSKDYYYAFIRLPSKATTNRVLGVVAASFKQKNKPQWCKKEFWKYILDYRTAAIK